MAEPQGIQPFCGETPIPDVTSLGATNHWRDLGFWERSSGSQRKRREGRTGDSY